jgi:ADP-heptose:LPS heptosyltransferase
MGDESARVEAEAIRARSRVPWRTQVAGPVGGVDLTGRTDLASAVAILRGATIFVGIDSGLMHLAAALGLPTVGLFGATSPAWTAPRGELTRVLAVEGFACQPCFRRRCNQETFCMTTLSGEAVYRASHDLLTEARAG